MSTITTAMIKELREATGAGPLDCKKALEASGGDMAAAKDALREKGMATALKKTERVMNAGRVVVAAADDAVAMVEVKCETDFVSNTPDVRSLAQRLAEQVLADPALTSAEAVLAAPYAAEAGPPVAQVVQALIGKLGENIAVRAARYAAAPDSVLEGYTHGGGLAGEFGPGEGRVGVLIEVAADPAKADRAALQALAHDLALHITVAAPRYVGAGDIPAAVLEEQRTRLTEELATDSKPEAIKAKIIQGRLDKFTQAACLLPQPFIRDDSVTVEQLLKQRGEALGTPVTVRRFVRLEPGEAVSSQQ